MRVASLAKLGIGVLLVIIAFVVWAYFFGLAFTLERHIIPPYQSDYASLKEIMLHYQQELAKQGKSVEIRVLNKENYDDVWCDVRGLTGNAYLYLFAVSEIFDTEFKCSPLRVITIHGVGSAPGRAPANSSAGPLKRD
jgi:hypothetical protein